MVKRVESTIVAVDPGQTSGFASGKMRNGHFEMELYEEVKLDNLGVLLEHLGTTVRLGGVVVMESFVLNPGSPPGGKWDTGLSPVYVIGWLDGALKGVFGDSWHCGGVLSNGRGGIGSGLGGIRVGRSSGFVFQSASEAKGMVTDARLKSHGLWVPGKKHARDACRHAELYCRKASAMGGNDVPV